MCPREQETMNAVRTGQWTNELRAHFASCAACAETAMVAGFLEQAAGTADTRVPEAGFVWWKSQLRARREAAARAERPIVVAERAAAVGTVLVAVWAAAWFSTESALVAMAAVGALVVLGVTAGSVLLYAWSRK